MKQKLYILLFSLFIVIPPIAGIFITSNNTENRALSEFPDIKDGLFQYLKGVDTYINDRTPFKNNAVQIVSMLENSSDKDYETKLGILGKDDWMFYKGDDGSSSINDYRGLRTPSEDMLEKTKLQIKDLDEKLQKKKAKLVILICPNKEDVYGQYLPKKYQSNNQKSYSQLMVNYLSKDMKNVIYPIKELKQINSFYKYDTHWNEIGAYAATLKVEEYLDYPSIPLNKTIVQKEKKDGGDMFSILRLKESDYDQEFSYHIQTGKKVESSEVKHINFGNSIPYRLIETSAENASKLFLIGDSYSTAMLPYLQEDFKTLIVFHRGDIEKFTLNEIHEGDVVMVEVVGRSADSIGDTCQRILERIDK